MRKTTIGIDYSEEGLRRKELVERLLITPPNYDILMSAEPHNLQQQIDDLWFTLSDQQKITTHIAFMTLVQFNRAEAIRINIGLLAMEIERKLEQLKKDI